MSELKADKTFVFGEECEAYKKSEADKVIAELNEQIEVLKHQACKMDCMTVKLYNEACDDLIHQKYKRCLAMARCCNRMFSSTFGKERYWQKWNRRWLELAERFKEAK